MDGAGLLCMNKNFNTSTSVMNIAIFASGTGTNAEQIIKAFENNSEIVVRLIVSNRKNAGVLEIAKRHNVDQLIINRELFLNEELVKQLLEMNINLIVLAGFLWKIPELLIAAYPDRILNIHPALLPNYGGHGMYGRFVHEAVIESTDAASGITIHLVDEKYDSGKILFQATCLRGASDTSETLASKIHLLEHTHFSKIIASHIKFLEG